MHRALIIAIIFAAPTLIGCHYSGTAHIVRAEPRGGEVALEGPYMESVASARFLMAEYCQGRFTIRAPDGAPDETVIAPNRGEETAEFDCVPHAPEQLASNR